MVNGSSVARLPDFGDSYIVTEFLKQHQYAARIYPKTTNTLRVLTMWDDEESRAPFVAFVIHRFGTARSFPVDNWGRGSLSAWVDGETGIVGPAAAAPTANSLEWHDSHPETKERIMGVKIPGWETIKARLLGLAGKCASVPYVGWDLVITDDGFSVIEGNNRTDVNLLQIHRPLLVDERVVRFYERQGVIRRH
jgi:hypothetical protein